MRRVRSGALAAALLLGSLPARAADVEVESESVYRSFTSPGLNANDEDVVLQPFSQSFRLSAAQREKNLQISFETYFRGLSDATNAFDPGIQQQARVYYAYVDVMSGRRNPLDFRVGRQMETSAGELVAFDGARVRYRGPLHIGLEAFAGETVSGYGAVVPLGLDDGGAHAAGGVTAGAAVFLVGIPGSEARLAVTRVNREGKVDREDVVLDGARRVFGRARIYGNLEVSTVLGKVEEAAGGGTIYAGRSIFVDVEGFHYTPIFGASSIFNVFSLSPYEEARLRVHGSFLSGKLGLWTRVGHAFYEGGNSSDNLSIGANSRISTHLTVTARGYLSEGFQGSRTGGAADLHVRVTDRIEILAGGTAAQSKTTLLPNATGMFLSALGGVQYAVPDRLDLSLLAEQYADPVTKATPRITASLRFQFGTGTARRNALDPAARRVH